MLNKKISKDLNTVKVEPDNKNSLEKELNLPKVSIVVIGHNEGGNLAACFTAIRSMNYPQEKLEVLYIDSNSNDDSVEIAKKNTNKIFLIKSLWPTAGEAFNRGIVESSCDFVHITGGDIQLHPEYLKKAIETLLEKKDIHCVTGYFIEKEMKGWNKILAFRREDDIAAGDHLVATPNGGTFKKEALLAVNGYDERIKKGQETELGRRFQEAGLKIWYRHIPQGTHDFELNSFKDMAKRIYISGYSSGHLLLLSLYEDENVYLKIFRNSAIKRLLDSGWLLCLLLVLIVFWGPLYALLWIPFYLLYYALRVFLKQRQKKRNYKIYQLFMNYFSLFSFFGILGFILFYLKLKIKGVALFHARIGLKL